jgi:hypothetical protein
MIGILDKKRFSLFNTYLTQHTGKISDFETLIAGYSLEDQKIESRIKAELVALIPEPDRTEAMIQLKKQYEETVKSEYNMDDYTIQEKEEEDEDTIYARGRTSSFDISYLETRKEIPELKTIIEDYIKTGNSFDKDISDLA